MMLDSVACLLPPEFISTLRASSYSPQRLGVGVSRRCHALRLRRSTLDADRVCSLVVYPRSVSSVCLLTGLIKGATQRQHHSRKTTGIKSGRRVTKQWTSDVTRYTCEATADGRGTKN